MLIVKTTPITFIVATSICKPLIVTLVVILEFFIRENHEDMNLNDGPFFFFWDRELMEKVDEIMIT